MESINTRASCPNGSLNYQEDSTRSNGKVLS